jgi:V/A-type H+-transporting ATPase subunit E
MGVETIIERIRNDANAERQQIEAESRSRVDRILMEAQTSAEHASQEIIRQGNREAAKASGRIISEARIKARQNVRTVKDELINQCFVEASGQLEKLASLPEYRQILKALIQEGARELAESDVLIIVNHRDRMLIGDIAGELADLGITITLSEETADTVGGVIVCTRSGGILVNNTFEARLRRLKKELLVDVSGILEFA